MVKLKIIADNKYKYQYYFTLNRFLLTVCYFFLDNQLKYDKIYTKHLKKRGIVMDKYLLNTEKKEIDNITEMLSNSLDNKDIEDVKVKFNNIIPEFDSCKAKKVLQVL